MKKLIKIAIAIVLYSVALISISGFRPVEQGIQRFRSIFTENVRVSNAATINTLTVTGDQTNAGDLTVTGDLNLTGDAVLPSGYPLAYATADNEIVCGNATVTDTLDITTTGLTTITYATAVMATDPATTAAYISIDPPSGITLTLNIWESDFTVGTTGADVYYCALGAQ